MFVKSCCLCFLAWSLSVSVLSAQGAWKVRPETSDGIVLNNLRIAWVKGRMKMKDGEIECALVFRGTVSQSVISVGIFIINPEEKLPIFPWDKFRGPDQSVIKPIMNIEIIDGGKYIFHDIFSVTLIEGEIRGESGLEHGEFLYAPYTPSSKYNAGVLKLFQALKPTQNIIKVSLRDPVSNRVNLTCEFKSDKEAFDAVNQILGLTSIKKIK